MRIILNKITIKQSTYFLEFKNNEARSDGGPAGRLLTG
jgi:hypothetical protein